MKNIKHKIIPLLIVFVLTVILAYITMIIAYAIPVKWVQKNVNSAYTPLRIELINNHSRLFDQNYMDADTYTNTLVLSQIVEGCAGNSCDDGNLDIFKESLINKYQYSSCISMHVFNSDFSNENDLQDFDYWRYWHGHLFLFKILFIFFDYNGVAICLAVALMLLVLLFLYLMLKRGLKRYIFVFLMMFAIFCIPFCAFSYHIFYAPFIVLIMSNIYLLFYKKIEKSSSFYLYFFLTGMIINYFDFWTNPLTTFSSIFILFLFSSGKDYSTKQKLKCLICYFLIWCLGYLLMWGAKWLLYFVIVGSDDAPGKLMWQMSVWSSNVDTRWGMDVVLTPYDVVKNNLWNLSINVMFWISFIVFIGYCICVVFRNRNNIKFKVKWNPDYFVYLLLACFPVVMYMCIMAHSSYHSYFTYKELSTTVMCFSIILIDYIYSCIPKNKLKS